jgi:EAL domain-containing protein (putative c-di-GMP-specific phosphodiesterase class I)
VLELTEHVAVGDYEVLAGPLNRLRYAGVRLAVDDAGAGFPSLQHVLDLAPNMIKLDHALVRDVDTDPARASLPGCLVLFADRIGPTLVAEGIPAGSMGGEDPGRTAFRSGDGLPMTGACVVAPSSPRS